MINRACTSVSILSLCVLLTSCASNASFEKMVVEKKPAASPKLSMIKENIGIQTVSGGRETNPLLSSQINNENFKRALEQSLRNTQLLSKLQKNDYQLDAQIIKITQPILGISMTVSCDVHYSLQDIKHKKTIYDKNITSTYTATFSDAAYGVKRLQIANEGAARKNIQQFIQDLYELN